MGRRNARSGRRSGSGAVRVPPRAYGYSGWDTTNTLATAAGAGLPGTLNTPWFRAGAFRVDSQVGSAVRYVNSCFSGATGWILQTSGANQFMQIRACNGAGTIVDSTPYSIVAGDVGKIIHWAGWWDGTDLHLAVRGVEVAPGVACAGYLTGISRTLPGQRVNNTLPADTITWLGLVGGNAAWTAADALAHYTACQAANRVVAATGNTARYDVATSSPGAVASTLPDLVGSATMTFIGGSAAGLVAETITDPDWT